MNDGQQLERIVRSRALTLGENEGLRNSIRRSLLANRVLIDQQNFTSLSPRILPVAFRQYDEAYFDGSCRALLEKRQVPLDFSFSKRMTQTGGMTVRHEERGRFGRATKTNFQIKISSTLLFQSFQDGRDIQVSGCRCTDRLDAMCRILEHEMIHLIEMMLWYESSCARRRFRNIAGKLFHHTESTHQLLTAVDVARDRFGIRAGDTVSFDHDGRVMTGRVNRITRRATVLIPHPAGQPFSDGGRYVKFYVPVAALRRVS